MNASHISRVCVGLAGVLFAGLALSIWIAPDVAARQFGVEPIRATGTAMLRADLGGLFAGLATLCLAVAWSGRRMLAGAAATMLGAIVTGRVLGWVSAGRIGADATELIIELAILAIVVSYTRISGTGSSWAGRQEPAVRSAPRWRRRLVVGSVVLALPVALAVTLMTPTAQQRIFDEAARRTAATVNAAPLADDALRVAVCGSSAPLPSAGRAKSCVAIFAGGRFFVVDVGPESVENLVLWGIPLSAVDGVLLTHFHSDHIGDLGELNLQTWAGGRKGPLHVYGGPGVEEVVAGFSRAYHLDQGYRTAHHTEQVMPSATWPMIPHTVRLDGQPTAALDRSTVVLDDGSLRITAFEVNHAPIEPAYAYRFDYKGRSALITGDLRYHAPLVRAAADVDLMVSEAIAVSMTRALGTGATSAGRSGTAAVMHDIEDYHMTPEEAVDIANDARVRHLAFYHLLPAPDTSLARRVFAQGVDNARQGDWTIADDGSLYTMPLGSDLVRVGRVRE